MACRFMFLLLLLWNIVVTPQAIRNNNATAFIHIGPPKTATTAIQYYLERSMDSLYRDGIRIAVPGGSRSDPTESTTTIETYPRIGQLAFCLWPEDIRKELHRPCDPNLLNQLWGYLNQTMQEGHNVVISNEWMQRNWTAIGLDHYLHPSWKNVIIVIYYRRFHDFCRSWFHFHRKRIHTLKETIVQFMRRMVFGNLNATTLKNISNNASLATQYMDAPLFHGYTWSALQRYQRVSRYSIQIENFHTRDPVENFFCHVLRANETCRNYQATSQQQHAMINVHNGNITKAGVMYHLEDVALEAHDRNFTKGIFQDLEHVDSDKMTKALSAQISKWSAIMTMRLWSTPNKTIQDLPIECLTEDEFNTLLALTMSYEEAIVPDYYSFSDSSSSSSSNNVRADVVQSRQDFCSVDAAQILESDEWEFLYAKEEKNDGEV